MLKIVNQVIIVIFVCISIILIISTYTFNKIGSQNSSKLSIVQLEAPIYEFINDDKINSTIEGQITTTVFRTFTCFLSGLACNKNQAENTLKHFDNSLFGLISQGITLPYTHPPASGIQTTISTIANAGLIPKSYAATGIGFGTISPLISLWTVTRNMSYSILIIIVVVIGFMIMFRMKLNPQTVVMVENAIPNIVLALIYITFSFAIVGFLIDLMYISIAFIIAILASGNITPITQQEILKQQVYFLDSGLGQLFSNLTNHSFLGFDILWNLPNALLGIVPLLGFIMKFIGTGIGILLAFKLSVAMAPSVEIIAQILGSPGINLRDLIEKWLTRPLLFAAVVFFTIIISTTIIVPLILGLIIFFTVIMIFFRLFFLLIGAYAKIILLTIFAPLYLLLEAIPGQKAFVQWLKYLLVEIAVFPTIIAIFMLVRTLSTNVFSMSSPNASGQINFPLLMGIRIDMLSLIVIFWILFMTPDFVMLIKQKILPKPAIPDAGLGVFFGGASTALGAGSQQLSHWSLLLSHMGFHPLQTGINKLKQAFKGGK